MKRLRDAKKTPDMALQTGILSDAEMADITEMNDLVAKVIAVDDYTPEALAEQFPDLAPPQDDPDHPSHPRKAAE